MDYTLGVAALAAGITITGVLCLRHPRVAAVLAVAFTVRAALAVANARGMPLPDAQGDALAFEVYAWRWASDGFASVLENFPGADAHFYTFMLALLYAATDRSPLMAQALSVIVGVGGVYSTWRLAREFASEQTAVRAAWVAALFPTLVLYSALTLREPFVYLSLVAGLYLAVRWQRTTLNRHALGAMLCFAAGVFFHGGIFVALVLFVLVYLGVELYRSLTALRARRLRPTGTALLLVVALGLAGLGSGSASIPKLGGLDRMLDTERWIGMMDSRGHGAAAYPEWLTPDAGTDLVWAVPVRMVYLLFAPFPWDVSRVAHLVGLADALLYLALAVLIVRNRRNILHDRGALLVVLLILPLLAAFAVGTGNFGAAVRHRAKFAGVLIALAAAAMVRREPTTETAERVEHDPMSISATHPSRGVS